MKLLACRNQFSPVSTIGDMYVDGVWECYTLEDVVRSGPKVFGQTAIPEGAYEVRITFSNRFKRDLPLLLGVAGFEGIRIHPGNTAENTEGCILVGRNKTKDFIGNSRDAFDNLYAKMLGAWMRKDPITIEVRHE